MSDAVVLVHGIWMTGLDLLLLRSRLRSTGYETAIARYPSLRRSPRENAALVREAVERVEADVVHLVGHSLGGLVILHLLRDHPPSRPGRVVLLGSPVKGSGVARVLASRRITRPLIGASGEAGLLDGVEEGPYDREIGTIAGDRALGVGRVLKGIDGPSDGTVAVAETRLACAHDDIVLPVNHTGLVLSRLVAENVDAFLREGRFLHEAAGDEPASPGG